jgi:hypothetical protein
MIEKTIHYCWFGNNPLPLQAKRCLASWAHSLPDYQIIRWDESNFDVYGHPFTQKAFQAGRYAFVADYVRMHVLYKYGGIYMDVDVHVCGTFDELLVHDFFIGLEDTQRFGTCVIGSKPNHWLSKQMLSYYDSLPFDDQNLKDLVNVNKVSSLLMDHGFCGQGNTETIGKDLVLGIGSFANPQSKKNLMVTPFAFHLYVGSWRKRPHKAFISRVWRSIRKSPDIFKSLYYLSYFKIFKLNRLAKKILKPGK